MKLRVTIDAQSFDVEVGDLKTRPVPVTVDGDTFMVWPEEEKQAAKPVERAASAGISSSIPAPIHVEAPSASGQVEKTRSVLAPIPGVIISISVKEGDAISFGQELCILEAMKMKNIIRANRTGTIAAIRVAAGDQVRHSQVLLEYTD
jgi:biotin carboxyl carrier protein